MLKPCADTRKRDTAERMTSVFLKFLKCPVNLAEQGVDRLERAFKSKESWRETGDILTIKYIELSHTKLRACY